MGFAESIGSQNVTRHPRQRPKKKESRIKDLAKGVYQSRIRVRDLKKSRTYTHQAYDGNQSEEE